jgi:hypothetical protein
MFERRLFSALNQRSGRAREVGVAQLVEGDLAPGHAVPVALVAVVLEYGGDVVLEGGDGPAGWRRRGIGADRA